MFSGKPSISALLHTLPSDRLGRIPKFHDTSSWPFSSRTVWHKSRRHYAERQRIVFRLIQQEPIQFPLDLMPKKKKPMPPELPEKTVSACCICERGDFILTIREPIYFSRWCIRLIDSLEKTVFSIKLHWLLRSHWLFWYSNQFCIDWI